MNNKKPYSWWKEFSDEITDRWTITRTGQCGSIRPLKMIKENNIDCISQWLKNQNSWIHGINDILCVACRGDSTTSLHCLQWYLLLWVSCHQLYKTQAIDAYYQNLASNQDHQVASTHHQPKKLLVTRTSTFPVALEVSKWIQTMIKYLKHKTRLAGARENAGSDREQTVWWDEENTGFCRASSLPSWPKCISIICRAITNCTKGSHIENTRIRIRFRISIWWRRNRGWNRGLRNMMVIVLVMMVPLFVKMRSCIWRHCHCNAKKDNQVKSLNALHCSKKLLSTLSLCFSKWKQSELYLFCIFEISKGQEKWLTQKGGDVKSDMWLHVVDWRIICFFFFLFPFFHMKPFTLFSFYLSLTPMWQQIYIVYVVFCLVCCEYQQPSRLHQNIKRL